ncbi:hypothetical protein Golob_021218, partial [Gossypium lobatum]|nr:hypothetical protein [Gossypium lobatum]
MMCCNHWLGAPVVETFEVKVRKIELNTEEEKLVNANSKTLNVIFYRVDGQEFKRISRCTTTKKPWIFLRLPMKEKNIYSYSKLVRKVLRSLPQRLVINGNTIKEARNNGNIRINEAIGSLKTFEMNLDESRNKSKAKRFKEAISGLVDQVWGEALTGFIVQPLYRL